MKLHSRRGKRQKKFLANERFATKTIVAIGVTTVIFITAQYVSLVIVARIKKKEQIEPETDTDESEVL